MRCSASVRPLLLSALRRSRQPPGASANWTIRRSRIAAAEAALKRGEALEQRLTALVTRLDGYARIIDDATALARLSGNDAEVAQALVRYRAGKGLLA